MLKRILVCAALLVPVTAFAGEPVSSPDDEKDLCVDIGPDPARCSLDPRCFFDTSDQRCEWIVDPGPCASIHTSCACNSMPNCFWDTSDVRCERIH
jgi:hypothetical protein